MSYRDFQRRHPHWPKRIRDAEGRKIKVHRRMSNRAGTVYEPGDICTIENSWRGYLDLRRDSDRKCINKVRPMDVILLPE